MSKDLKTFIKEETRRQEVERKKVEERTYRERDNQSKVEKKLQVEIVKKQVLEIFDKTLSNCLDEIRDFQSFTVSNYKSFTDIENFCEAANQLGFQYMHDYATTYFIIPSGDDAHVLDERVEERLSDFRKKLSQKQKYREKCIKAECLNVKEAILDGYFEGYSDSNNSSISVPSFIEILNHTEFKIVEEFFAEFGLHYTGSKGSTWEFYFQ